MKRLAILTALVLGGCTAQDPVILACTDELVPAFRIGARDSASGKGLLPPYNVYVREAAYVDSALVRVPMDSTYLAALAHERAGVYTAEVIAPGYRAWRAEHLIVTKDECHVRTVEMVARLQR